MNPFPKGEGQAARAGGGRNRPAATPPSPPFLYHATFTTSFVPNHIIRLSHQPFQTISEPAPCENQTRFSAVLYSDLVSTGRRKPPEGVFVARTLRCELLESRMLLSIYYVDAINGKDTYSGLAGTHTSGTTGPWQTLAKVNSKTFRAGDSILFQYGEVWRGQLVTESGSSSGRITYGVYGDSSLAKPLFLGSVEKDSASNWTSAGTNLWSTTVGTVDPGNVIYNNGQSCGLECWSLSDVNSQGNWYQTSGSGYTVTIYSTVNPASYYSDIEIALNSVIVYGANYTTIQNLALKYGAYHGIQFLNNKHDFTVSHCDISFIGGGGAQYSRWGNGIELYGTTYNAVIRVAASGIAWTPA